MIDFDSDPGWLEFVFDLLTETCSQCALAGTAGFTAGVTGHDQNFIMMIIPAMITGSGGPNSDSLADFATEVKTHLRVRNRDEEARPCKVRAHSGAGGCQ